jgi:hypothetical protein
MLDLVCHCLAACCSNKCATFRRVSQWGTKQVNQGCGEQNRWTKDVLRCASVYQYNWYVPYQSGHILVEPVCTRYYDCGRYQYIWYILVSTKTSLQIPPYPAIYLHILSYTGLDIYLYLPEYTGKNFSKKDIPVYTGIYLYIPVYIWDAVPESMVEYISLPLFLLGCAQYILVYASTYQNMPVWARPSRFQMWCFDIWSLRSRCRNFEQPAASCGIAAHFPACHSHQWIGEF